MTRRSALPVSLATYADHEVITPPHALRQALTHVADADDYPVARAEAALTQLSSEFADWMHWECERLEAARQNVHRRGFTGRACEELFRAAHDIKGEAATFGYPAAARAAASLCRLIEHTPEFKRIPIVLVDQHVDAVRAIAREQAQADHAVIAETLTRRLREVTDEFLRDENRERPDHLEAILSPPLAPEGAGA